MNISSWVSEYRRWDEAVDGSGLCVMRPVCASKILSSAQKKMKENQKKSNNTSAEEKERTNANSEESNKSKWKSKNGKSQRRERPKNDAPFCHFHIAVNKSRFATKSTNISSSSRFANDITLRVYLCCCFFRIHSDWFVCHGVSFLVSIAFVVCHSSTRLSCFSWMAFCACGKCTRQKKVEEIHWNEMKRYCRRIHVERKQRPSTDLYPSPFCSFAVRQRRPTIDFNWFLRHSNINTNSTIGRIDCMSATNRTDCWAIVLSLSRERPCSPHKFEGNNNTHARTAKPTV